MIAKKTVNTLIASAVALTLAGAAGSAMAEKSAAKEKCYGVVKAGANDCANAAKTHSCAGQAATDGEGGEFIALPAGVCERLAHGSTSPVAAEAATDAAHDAAGDAADHATDKAVDAVKDHAKDMMDKH